MKLRLCASCCRHVRVDEASCPFCGSSLSKAEPPSRTLTGAVLLGLGLAAAAACGPIEVGPPSTGAGGAIENGGASGVGGREIVPLYAAVPIGGTQVGSGGTSHPSGVGGGMVVLYGPPPVMIDAGQGTGGTVNHGGKGGGVGNPVPLYAAVPHPVSEKPT